MKKEYRVSFYTREGDKRGKGEIECPNFILTTWRWKIRKLFVYWETGNLKNSRMKPVCMSCFKTQEDTLLTKETKPG